MTTSLIQVEEMIEQANEYSYDTSFLESIESQLRDNRLLTYRQELAIKNIQASLANTYIMENCDATEIDLF